MRSYPQQETHTIGWQAVSQHHHQQQIIRSTSIQAKAEEETTRRSSNFILWARKNSKIKAKKKRWRHYNRKCLHPPHDKRAPWKSTGVFKTQPMQSFKDTNDTIKGAIIRSTKDTDHPWRDLIDFKASIYEKETTSVGVYLIWIDFELLQAKITTRNQKLLHNYEWKRKK